MSSPNTIDVLGIGPVNLSRAEYTDPQVAKLYNQYLSVITAIYERREPVSNQPASSEFTADDYDDLIEAMQNLSNLAENGWQGPMIPGNPDSPTVNHYLTTRMASSLDLVFRSLAAAGIVVPSAITDTTDKKNAVIQWIDLAGFGVTEILQSAVSAGLSNKSLQSLIELDYVRTGNEIIFEGLTNLEGALSATQGAIDALNELQTLRNLIETAPILSFRSFCDTQVGGIYGGLFNGGFDDDFFVVKYKSAMSFYLKTVIPKIPNTEDIGDLTNRIFSVRSRLNTQLEKIEQASPGNSRSTPGTLAFNLNQLIGNINTVFSSTDASGNLIVFDKNSPPSSLYQKTRDFILVNQGEERVIGNVPASGSPDIHAALSNAIRTQFSALTKNKNIDLQTSINSAITSAQSLNDTQKQEVRRFLFVFEEFYKSSSSILTKISQLIEKFAQGIAR